MTVFQLNEDQLSELKSKLWFDNICLSSEEFTEANGEPATEEIESAICPDSISDETVYHFFDGIDFVVDDFFCTTGMYDLEERLTA